VQAIAPSIVTLVFAGLLQAVSSPGLAVDPPTQEPLKIDAFTSSIHLLGKPELAYPKEALQQHIEGKVKLELTVSPQGDVVSERVVWGPSALQQATLDAFKKVKYIPFRRDGEPSLALVRVIVAYEKEHATISTESEHEAHSAQLRPPIPNIANEFTKYSGSMSAEPAVQQAASAAAAGHGSQVGTGGDFGLSTGARGRPMGNLEILSDTQGVDFKPYLQDVLRTVRHYWYPLVPASAQMKHGNVVIEFAIMKDGSVQGPRIVMSSNDVALDRPAYASITASDPFPPLPREFNGQYLALRFRFVYNPTMEELGANPTASPSVVK
jgi:TonB family protein